MMMENKNCEFYGSCFFLHIHLLFFFGQKGFCNSSLRKWKICMNLQIETNLHSYVQHLLNRGFHSKALYSIQGWCHKRVKLFLNKTNIHV